MRFIGLNINPQDTRTPELHISGNLVNNGYISLYPRSVFTVAGGLSGSGNISIYGLPVTCEVLGVWNQNGGSVHLGGSGLDGFVLKAIAFNAQNTTTVSGNGTMEASVTITSGTMSPGNSPGTIIVKGDLTLEAGAKYDFTPEFTAPDKDPNEDSLQNLKAYFRGIPADGATTFKGLNSALTGGGLVLTLRSPRTVTGVTLTSKISATLESWEDGPVPVLAGTTPTRNIYQITIPASDPRRFARFVMTQNESPVPP